METNTTKNPALFARITSALFWFDQGTYDEAALTQQLWYVEEDARRYSGEKWEMNVPDLSRC